MNSNDVVEWDGSIRAWKEDEHKLKRAVICLVAFCFLLLTECQIIPIQMLLMTFNLFFLHVSPNGRHLKNKQTTTTTIYHGIYIRRIASHVKDVATQLIIYATIFSKSTNKRIQSMFFRSLWLKPHWNFLKYN